jgi:hypothetical membrane protein
MTRTISRPPEGHHPAPAKSCGEVMSHWWHSPRATMTLLAGGVVAGAVYAAGDLLSGLLYSGYSFSDQAISELTAFGSPVRPLMLTTMIVHGLPVLAFGVGMWRASERKSIRAIGALAIASSIFWLPNHTIWAMSSRWMEGGFNDTMHQAGSTVWVVLMTTAIVLSAVATRGRFRVFALGTLLVFLVFGAAAGVQMLGIDQNLTPWAGGFERISCYAYFVWLAVLAVVIRRSLSSTAREPEVTGAVARTRGPAVLGSH